MFRLSVLVMLVSLAACSSKPLRVNYYLLYTAEPNSQSQVQKTKQIVLNEIILADYLKQSGLAMKLDQNKIYFSRQDVWAESLQSSIFGALLNDLNQAPDIQFITSHEASTDIKPPSITVKVDHFYATQNSTVETSGRYLLSDESRHINIETPFYFKLELQQDGYSHAVSQQRQLVNLLAQNILLDLNKVISVRSLDGAE